MCTVLNFFFLHRQNTFPWLTDEPIHRTSGHIHNTAAMRGMHRGLWSTVHPFALVARRSHSGCCAEHEAVSVL